MEGPVRVAVRAEGFLAGYTEVAAGPDQPDVDGLVIAVTPSEPIAGIARSPSGAPIYGALVFSGSGSVPLPEYRAVSRHQPFHRGA